MQKRNKRTLVASDHQISPVTDYILARMGDEGVIIRQRLEHFYQTRTTSESRTGKEDWNSNVIRTSHDP